MTLKFINPEVESKYSTEVEKDKIVQTATYKGLLSKINPETALFLLNSGSGLVTEKKANAAPPKPVKTTTTE